MHCELFLTGSPLRILHSFFSFGIISYSYITIACMLQKRILLFVWTSKVFLEIKKQKTKRQINLKQIKLSSQPVFSWSWALYLKKESNFAVVLCAQQMFYCSVEAAQNKDFIPNNSNCGYCVVLDQPDLRFSASWEESDCSLSINIFFACDLSCVYRLLSYFYLPDS